MESKQRVAGDLQRPPELPAGDGSRCDSVVARRGRVVLGLALVLMAAAVLLVLATHDPAEHGLYPGCHFREMTGWYCAGCGGTRAAYALVHLDFGGALAMNPLFVVAFPFLAALVAMEGGAWLLGERYRGPRVRLPVSCAWWLPAVFLAFWILRNVPNWPFTLLAP
jgi:hypothetical protein